MKKIGIIGGGFSGLGVAHYLLDKKNEKKYDVTIIESSDCVGGLASGFKEKEWSWPVDKVIHHWFTTDKWALDIAEKIGLKYDLIIKDTKSSCFYNGKIAELDSVVSLLKFPFLKSINRLRTGAVMAWLRLDKNYLRYEKMTSFDFIKKFMGEESFRVLWEPLFLGKFGNNAKDVNAAWFWARIHPRTKSLAYIKGGFQTFSDKLASSLSERGTKIFLKSRVKKITNVNGKFIVEFNKRKETFDYLVMAVPLSVALKLYNFPIDFSSKYSTLKSIGAQYFVLELKEPFLKDGTYWLNVNDSSFPFMMVAEHTNFVDKKHYNNKSIIWIGKYLDKENELWDMKEKDLLKKIIPYLKRINPSFSENNIERSFFTRFENAQPIISLNYSAKIPPIETPIKNLYLANMNQIYPWDRGTNNALGLGEKIAEILKKDSI